MSKLRHFYKRIRYWRQRRQGFALLEDIGTKVTITDIAEVTRKK